MNKGAIIAGIIGVGAVGLGVYALTRNSQPQQQNNTDSAFNGFVGGGSTGGTTGANSAVSLVDSLSNAMNNMWSSVQPQSIDEIIPLMDSIRNPSDEVADVKQTTVMDSLQNIYASRGGSRAKRLSTSRKDSTLMQNVTGDQNSSSSTTPAEYNQGNSFAPTPKQADMSSYNEQKTGGGTENTPKQTSAKKDSAEKSSTEGLMSVTSSYGANTNLPVVSNFVGAMRGLFGW